MYIVKSGNKYKLKKIALQSERKKRELEEAKKAALEREKKTEEERVAEGKRKEEERVAEGKRKEEEFKKLEPKHSKKCTKSYYNPKGFEKGTPEYKNCIYDTEKKEIAKAQEKESTDQAKKEPQSSEINPDLLPIGSGSGFYINKKGYALTNSHVVEICEQVITIVDGQKILFHIIATDQIIDIGLIKATKKNSEYLSIESDGAKLGEDVIAVGFPLSNQLSDSVKITKGIVSALSGIGNNSAQIQIDAALQPGNSGGPILNKSGDVVGIASAGLNKLLMAKEAKYIPENVNFAVATPSIATFLKTKKIKYSTGSFFSKEYSTHELAEIGQKSTIQLFCLNTRAAYAKLKRSKKYTDVLLDLN
jgi:S1-C subfamily serine protease